jgi:hypothetical protein
MPLVEFVCYGCGESHYKFEEDLYTNPQTKERYPGYACDCGSEHYCRMPPKVTIIHRTEIFMLTQLDTVHTIHDLDAELQREAAEEREVKQQNAARKEL